jgi:hypothetical protein
MTVYPLLTRTEWAEYRRREIATINTIRSLIEEPGGFHKPVRTLQAHEEYL